PPPPRAGASTSRPAATCSPSGSRWPAGHARAPRKRSAAYQARLRARGDLVGMTSTALPTTAPARAAMVDVVVPVLNEAEALPGSIRALHAHLCERFPWRWRIVIADNGSTDGT